LYLVYAILFDFIYHILTWGTPLPQTLPISRPPASLSMDLLE
jgi:hypothetical protein